MLAAFERGSYIYYIYIDICDDDDLRIVRATPTVVHCLDTTAALSCSGAVLAPALGTVHRTPT